MDNNNNEKPDEIDNLKATKRQDSDSKLKPKKKFELRPVPTIYSTVTCFIFFGLLFLALGVIILILSSYIKDISIRYDNLPNCERIFLPNKNNTTISEEDFANIIKNKLEPNQCQLTFTLFETFEAPVMFYYELNNFYQNHRRYMKSMSISQLSGDVLNTTDTSFDCDPIVTVKDLGINKTFGGFYLSDKDPANPCGLYPKSFFNDTYSLKNEENKNLFINETNIAWNSDRSFKFKSPLNAERLQWINVTDEHFMVWMRPAATNNFRKLWGRINEDIPPGNYTLTINNNYNVSYFEGKKSIVLSTANIFGGKNSFIGTLYIIIGSICLLSAALFAIAYSNKVLDDKKKTL